MSHKHNNKYFFPKDHNVSFGWADEEQPTQSNEAFICTPPPNEHDTETQFSLTVNPDDIYF